MPIEIGDLISYKNIPRWSLLRVVDVQNYTGIIRLFVIPSDGFRYQVGMLWVHVVPSWWGYGVDRGNP